jgi:glycerophosphoryl diester phosphodiesterase
MTRGAAAAAVTAVAGAAALCAYVIRCQLNGAGKRMQLRRGEELAMLRNMIAKAVPCSVLECMVAHRGFHSADDLSDVRPIENTRSAYEQAWASGVKLCECDVAVTADGHVVLCHDKNFARLALRVPGSDAQRSSKVGSLTFAQLVALPLLSGQRPPLLTEVLESARAIGNGCALVVEVKKGNDAAPAALCRLFAARPELLPHVAVVMSFDAAIMHTLRSLLRASLGPSPAHTPRLLLLALARRGPIAGPKIADRIKKGFCFFEVDAPPAAADWLDKPSAAGEAPTHLDGVYLQFQPQMLTPAGVQTMRALTDSMAVGVWGFANLDPDDVHTAQRLIRECGVAYVNTDLPRGFAT